MDDNMFLQLILEELKGLREDVSKQRETVNSIVNDVTLNNNFRKGMINGVKYIAGACFVAVLGIIGAIIPNVLNQHFADGSKLFVQHAVVSENVHIHYPVKPSN